MIGELILDVNVRGTTYRAQIFANGKVMRLEHDE